MSVALLLRDCWKSILGKSKRWAQAIARGGKLCLSSLSSGTVCSFSIKSKIATSFWQKSIVNYLLKSWISATSNEMQQKYCKFFGHNCVFLQKKYLEDQSSSFRIVYRMLQDLYSEPLLALLSTNYRSASKSVEDLIQLKFIYQHGQTWNCVSLCKCIWTAKKQNNSFFIFQPEILTTPKTYYLFANLAK